MMNSATRGPRFRREIPGARQAIADQERAGCEDQLFIRLGGRAGMKLARERRDALVCPIDADPAVFKWPVRQADVYVLNITEQLQPVADELAIELLEQGARLVTLLRPDGSKDRRVGHQAAADAMFESQEPIDSGNSAGMLGSR